MLETFKLCTVAYLNLRLTTPNVLRRNMLGLALFRITCLY